MKQKMNPPDLPISVTQVLKDLEAKGYSADLNKCLITEKDPNFICEMSEFQIDKSYRFEGVSDPADEAIIYAVSSDKHRLKGYLLDGYGIYSDPKVEALAKKMKKLKSPK